MTGIFWGTVVTQMVSVFRAATTVPVYDGIPATYAELAAGVAVGTQADSDDGQAGSLDQDWHEAGPAPFAHRKENGSVWVTIWAQSGNDDLASVRTVVEQVMSDLVTSVAPVTTLGLPELVGFTMPARVDVQQRRTRRGVIAQLVITCTYEAII